MRVVVATILILFRGDAMKTNRKAEMAKRARSAIMAECFVRAMDNWLRANSDGLPELDEICQKFDVSFEDAVGVSLEIGQRRRTLVETCGSASNRVPIESWPMLERLTVMEKAFRLFTCNQAGEPVKSRWAAIWGLVPCVLRFGAVVAGVVGLILAGYLMARAGSRPVTLAGAG